jgi:hypothetical protein
MLAVIGSPRCTVHDWDLEEECAAEEKEEEKED